jgi:serine/threonine-protein kinase
MGPLLAGRYELGPRLGTGGMAEVVRGLDSRLGRPVAIKLVASERVDPSSRERFRREAMTSAGFNHPHAVTTYDAGEADGWLYLVMELVEGPTLAQRLESWALDPAEALRITDALLDALASAHAAGLVHRDVKPGNVLLGPDGIVKLGDFGIARRFDDVALTSTGTFVGTARYASPEQLAGEPATPASDIYSTGVVLYEMLTGRPPFDGDSAMAIAMAHHHTTPPDVRTAAPTVAPGLARAVGRALAKDPAARFPSADAMRAALTGHTAVAPVIGPRPAARPRPRRQRWWWAAAALLLLIGVTVAAIAARDEPAGDAGGDPTAPPASLAAAGAPTTAPATAPATAAPPTTTATTTTAAPTTAAPTATLLPAAGSVEELLAAIATPDQLGPRTTEIVRELERIDRRGRVDARRARRLLDNATAWTERGELDPAVLASLETVLGPLADEQGRGGEGNDDDE